MQRPTVYSNFPHEGDLFAACQAHFLAEHPPPDPTAALALADPAERIHDALLGLYAWYRETEAMTGNTQRDRRVLPALDALLADGADRQLDRLAGALAGGGGACPLVRLALEFSTWKRLTTDGLSDEEAAALMARAAASAAG